MVQKSEVLEEMLPEISIFCKMFIKYQEQLFVTMQLLEILKLLDFSDEAGRRNLSILLRKLHLFNNIFTIFRKRRFQDSVT